MSVQRRCCWLVRKWGIPEVWRGDCAQVFWLHRLILLASSKLTCIVVRLGWRCGMGRMVKKISRATEYDVINAELEVRGPKL